MFQAFKTFFRKTDIRGNGKKKTEITLYIFTRPNLYGDLLTSNKYKMGRKEPNPSNIREHPFTDIRKPLV